MSVFKRFDNEDDNNIFESALKSDNYRVVNTGYESNIVIVFFSSHGLYYPNNIDEFKRQVLENNRYEWENISKDIHNASKFIFVRDIKKIFFLEGINSQYDSQDKLTILLQRLIGHKDSVFVGNSAGAYAAMFFGIKLNAVSIFAFSPIFDINVYYNYHQFKYYDYFKENQDGKYTLDIVDLIKSYKNGDVFCFYPLSSAEDEAQMKLLNNSDAVIFPILSRYHGVELSALSKIYILNSNNENLSQLVRFGRNKKRSSFAYDCHFLGFICGLRILLKKYYKILRG